MKLKHVDLIANRVDQDAREVRTKFSKTFSTFFFPVGDEIRENCGGMGVIFPRSKVMGWRRSTFPGTRIAVGETRQFEVTGLERSHWSNASPIRTIFREAFERAGVPYFNPHSFRNTLVQLGQKLCKSAEEFKAWSQNLGHDGPLTTLTSYGEFACQRQGEIIRDLATPQPAGQSGVKELAEAMLKELRDSGVDMQVK